ncbi:hypothetical protein [Ruminococcus sp.]|uniref:hypothetical protein n=1 Tax=Ruminococcus sp. TaxID=41978 RepID=UPI001B72CCCD|nr:hypothetical protein [Ruminococcus sp.]MBP5432176.1 hypothetical protein [Ruminococcus sp.]
MAEYIRRDIVLDIINTMNDTGGFAGYADYSTLFDEIDTMPASDVQPVVRCKDCKHRKEHHYEEDGEKPYIKYECKFTKYSMSDDGFCSFGARMDGDAE